MSPANIARDVEWLADDAREGRGLGTQGLDDAADYIAASFARAGLAPGGDADTYLQAFEMPVAIRVGSARVAIGSRNLVRGREFDALLSSESARAEGRLIYVGYGISAPEIGYDDYEGIDVQGGVVLVLEDRPDNAASGLTGIEGVQFLRRSYKIANARRHGALVILLVPADVDVLGLPEHSLHESEIPTVNSVGIIALSLSRAGAEHVMIAAGGDGLSLRQQSIEQSGRPDSRIVGDVPVVVEVDIERRIETVNNVVARRIGTDPALRREIVVIGAHYDHLGEGRFSSLTPSRRGEIHNGADDNASGTAGLLELARAFGEQPPSPRTLVFVAFTGEEAGLVGSTEFVKRVIDSDEECVAMLNLDMVGRLRDGRLTVFGTETSAAFPALVRGAVAGMEIDLTLGDSSYVPSDQTNFHAKEIPVLSFFTGSHAEYHTPDDDSQLVNPAGEADVLSTVFRTTRALLDASARPRFAASFTARVTGSPRGYGPYLGTIPQFAGDPGRGLLLQGTRSGSPAEIAGLRAGDRIIEFDGASVANLEEFAGLLHAARAGTTVAIVFLREGQRIDTAATLGRRR